MRLNDFLKIYIRVKKTTQGPKTGVPICTGSVNLAG